MPSLVGDQFDNVRSLIETGQVEAALDCLAAVEGFREYASGFRSRLSRIKDQNRRGRLTHNEANTEYTKLSDDILGLVSEDFTTFDEEKETLQSQYAYLRPVPKEAPFILPQLDIPSFTGRRAELEQLEATLFSAAGPRVAGIAGLTGAGGMGKSALAFHFATLFRDRFPDGVIGLRVDGGDAEIIAQRFASYAGASIAPGQKLSASEIMQSVFQSKQALLIFDNAEDATVKVLRPGGNRCAVIITTRNKGLLKSLEVPDAGHVDLDPFTLDETRELLGKIIGEQRVNAEREAAERIFSLVGGLPLAIRIVGGDLDDQPFTSLTEFASQLGDEKLRLERLRDPDDPDLNVKASFELSLNRLERQGEATVIKVFACLGACPREGFSLQAAQVVSEQDEDVIRGVMGRLTRLSLVNRGDQTDEFILHPLLFLFAQQKAESYGWLADAERRHTEYYLGYALDHGDPSSDNFKALEAELPSLLLAGRRLAAAGRTSYGVYVALEPFLEAGGHWSQALDLIERFAEVARAADDFSQMAQLSLQKGQFLQLQGKFEEAKTSFLESESHAAHIESAYNRQRTQAMILNSLGGVYQRQGKFGEAVAALERSKEIGESLGDERSLAMILNSLGGVYQRQGKFDLAADALEQSRQLSQKLGDERGVAMILNSLGGVYQRQGKFGEAVAALERSKEIREKFSDEPGLAMVLNSLGGVYQRQGKFDLATATFEQGKQISQKLGDERNLAMILNSLGSVYQRQGRFDLAIAALEQSREISGKLGDERGVAMVLNSLGGVYQRQGKLDLAIATLMRSKEIEEKLGNERGLAMSLTSLGSVYQRQGKFDLAVAAFEQSKEIEEKLDNERGLAIVLSSLGVLYQQQGDLSKAVGEFERSSQIQERLGDRRGLAIVLGAWGKALLNHKDPRRAAEKLKRSFDIDETLKNARGLRVVTPPLVRALTILGQKDEARDYVKRALAIVATDYRLLTLERQLAESHPVSQDTVIKAGTVKHLVRNLSGYLYGFISPEDEGDDIYFGEETVARTLLPNLTEGIKVRAEVELSARGPRARNVWEEGDGADGP